VLRLGNTFFYLGPLYCTSDQESTKCRINTVIFPDDGHIVARNMYRLINILRNKHSKKNCAPSWLHLQDYTGMHGQQNIKIQREENTLLVVNIVKCLRGE